MGKENITLGLIGYGYWGPNVARNFSLVENCIIDSICDIDITKFSKLKKLFPQAKITSNHHDLLEDKNIDAVAIVTPVSSHFSLAKQALENGKHVFITKPFVSSVKEAEILIELAEKRDLIIAVDHTFLFTGSVKRMKELVQGNKLGTLYHFQSKRVNLGLFQNDVNVVWDLAAHDFSIMDYILPFKPVAISANGIDHFNRNLENTAFISIYFEANFMAHIDVSWFSPVKIRQTLLAGAEQMLIWNDLEPDEKIRIYDRGVKLNTNESKNLQAEYRLGDANIPRLDNTEALKAEAEHFINAILSKSSVINDAQSGLRVVQLLEATSASLKKKGALIEL